MLKIKSVVKKTLILAAALFLTSQAFAQEEESEAAKSFDFMMQFEPAFYLNTESYLVSAPSPIIYPVTIGLLLPNNSPIAFAPTISFFMMNHLLYEEKALPAEIENRTSTTLSFMLNLPAVYSIMLENSRFQFNAGLGIFMRFGLLSPGVKEDDSGWMGTAAEDVAAINSWFWNDLRWLYTNFGISWLYNLTPQLRAGPTINVYLPVGGLINDKDAQGLIISAGIKICR